MLKNFEKYEISFVALILRVGTNVLTVTDKCDHVGFILDDTLPKEKPFDAVKFMRQIREKYKLETKETSNSGVSLIPK